MSSVHAIPEMAYRETIYEAGFFSAASVVGGYAKTKAEATQSVLDASRKGLQAVIVHPSGIIGPYDKGNNHLVQLVIEYMNGKLPVCVKGGYDFVDVRDVAAGCLLAAEKGKQGQCYILSGHYLSIQDMLSGAGKYCNKKSCRQFLSFWQSLRLHGLNHFPGYVENGHFILAIHYIRLQAIVIFRAVRLGLN